MSDMIEYQLDGGGSVLVAVESGGRDGVVTRGWGDKGAVRVAERANQTFESVVGTLRPAADAIVAAISGMQTAPSEICVEFAVQFTADAGVCIATLGSSANFKISMTWQPK